MKRMKLVTIATIGAEEQLFFPIRRVCKDRQVGGVAVETLKSNIFN